MGAGPPIGFPSKPRRVSFYMEYRDGRLTRVADSPGNYVKTGSTGKHGPIVVGRSLTDYSPVQSRGNLHPLHLDGYTHRLTVISSRPRH
jgi:hypothetical protein